MALRAWLCEAETRLYPGTSPGSAQRIQIDAARNEPVSFQVGLRLEDEDRQDVQVRTSGPQGWEIRVRRVGLIPVRHLNPPITEDTAGVERIPGFVPDPLFDEDGMFLPEAETRAFWITVDPGGNAAPGEYEVKVTVSSERGHTLSLQADIHLYDVVLEPRRNFHVTQWFYADALIDWYETDLFNSRFWEILPRYIRDVVAHGQDTLYVPVFTPPLDGIKRPTQLLSVFRVEGDTYRFNWRDIKHYIETAKASGITHFEWCHLFSQWGVKHALRVYEGQGKTEQLLWPAETPATSETYRSFLSQFLPALHRFLEVEDLLDRSFFHVSDEPHAEHLENYRAARAMLEDLAPWISVMDALSDIEFARKGLTDMPIPSISTALDFVAEDIPCWCYYCCGPRGYYLNRLLDTPLSKIAMHGLLFYRWPFKGFLHWGYNYWYRSQTRILIDPYTVQDGEAWYRGWAYGDPFEVYPGPEGPIDSIRWEIFGQSLRDYALLQTLGIPRDHPKLAPIRSFEDFPKTGTWRKQLRAQLLAEAEGASG